MSFRSPKAKSSVFLQFFSKSYIVISCYLTKQLIWFANHQTTWKNIYLRLGLSRGIFLPTQGTRGPLEIANDKVLMSPNQLLTIKLRVNDGPVFF